MSSITGLNAALSHLSKIKTSMSKARLSETCYQVADEAAGLADTVYASMPYDGTDTSVSVTAKKNQSGASITASGASVLFREFGTGIYNSVPEHPQAGEFGMGPGTWPDPHYSRNSSGELVANWENDLGWWFEDGGTYKHTFGNPPAMAMYAAGKLVKDTLPDAVIDEMRVF